MAGDDAAVASGDEIVRSATEWLRILGEPVVAEGTGGAPVLGPEPVSVRMARSERPIHLGKELLGWIEEFGEVVSGTLTLTPDRLRFAPATGIADAGFDWCLGRITVVQPASSDLQVAAGPVTVASIRFSQSSVRYWTRAITVSLRRLHAARGRDVVQFMPVIRTIDVDSGSVTDPARARTRADAGGLPTDAWHGAGAAAGGPRSDETRERGGGAAGGLRSDLTFPGRDAAARGAAAEPGPRRRQLRTDRYPPPPAPGAFYWAVHALPRLLWKPFGSLEAVGLEHIPSSGPFLLISNHQSVLDPFFIQTVLARPCHPMAKSTPFGSRAMAWVMRRVYAFPVRRYRVDPQAVRVALRRLQQGHPVHIYIEGERTWDGGLQRPRPGTVRLALRAGVPVIPCGIEGAYDAWPRWHRGVRPGAIRVAFGEPLILPTVSGRHQHDAELPAATARIMEAIRALLPHHAVTSASDDA